MNDKLGRNDLCDCGSGKKYKKCCISTFSPTATSSNVIELEWRKLRQLEGSVLDQHLIPYLLKTLPESVLQLAMQDCLPEDLPEQLENERLFNQFLLPWILFNWIPDEDFELDEFDPDITLAENYLYFYKSKLNKNEQRFINEMSTTFYSFYAILEVEKEKSLLVKDLLLGSTHTVKEYQGTYHLTRGDIVFSRILNFEHQSIFVGMAPFMLPPQYHTALLDFKKWLIEEMDNQPLNEYALRCELEQELLEYYFEAMIEAFNPKPKILVNTDNELIQFTASHFKIHLSLEETLNALLPMTLSKKPDEFLEDAKRTKAGKISEIKFRWLKKGNKKNKEWQNTVHGDVTIKTGKLILETNSVERSERGKKLLYKLLGDSISFQKTLIESQERKMKSLAQSQTEENGPDLEATPEFQELIRKLAKDHWESWFDTHIPALGDKTPREAVKTADGLEELEALLLEYECRDQMRDKNDPLKVDVHWIKTKLGLEK